MRLCPPRRRGPQRQSPEQKNRGLRMCLLPNVLQNMWPPTVLLYWSLALPCASGHRAAAIARKQQRRFAAEQNSGLPTALQNMWSLTSLLFWR